ncbi:MAG: nucleosidase [Bacteroidales bacterium]|nr:nucleosidase [Bacteroidales bacterium]
MKTILVTHAVKEEFIPLEIEGYNIIHINTGVGKTKSAFFLTKKICEESPDFILNVGTAGTLFHNIGDIFIAKYFIDRDYQATKLPGIEYQIDGLDLLGDNRSLKDWILSYNKKGICSTGDTFVTDISTSSGDMVDMEADSQEYVCKELGIPFLSIKYITDIIGKNSVEQWEDKLAEARTALTNWFNEHPILSILSIL